MQVASCIINEHLARAASVDIKLSVGVGLMVHILLEIDWPVWNKPTKNLRKALYRKIWLENDPSGC